MLRWQARITILAGEERCMGEGPYRLLRLAEEKGSLRQAALCMGMSYSKAHALVKRLENALQNRVLQSQTGGKSGGGTQLTPFGKKLLAEYARLQGALNASAAQAYAEFCHNLRLEESTLASQPTKTERLGAME